MTPASIDEIVDYVRAFNRFYTRRIGLLEDGLLGSGYTLAEARILFELAATEGHLRRGPSPSLLVEELNIDPGYLSRIVKKLEGQGLVVKTRSETDGRRIELSLSPSGREVAAKLDGASQQEIAVMLELLGQGDRAMLVDAMRTIERLLGSPLAVPGDDARPAAPHALLQD
jgi:DNA-binding MarR family transcriptional regulator